ncbi:MAG: V-type ATP synthase subunit A [Candidatus Diapherotrites archaeon]|nr:V-type ATP synthase subunit A [Candidatus Diapherotrites archaeon]
MENGRIARISGPVIEARGMLGASINEVVRVGREGLIGEVIRLNKDMATIQVYEETSGLMPGEPVEGTGKPLSLELGPGLLGSVYDGIQRPLETVRQKSGDFIARGTEAPALDRKKKWRFKPLAKNGEQVKAGQIIGTVQESKEISHKILVPPHTEGKISDLKEGDFSVEETIAKIDGKPIKLMQEWPVKKKRPYLEKLPPSELLTTGQRVIDFLFPVPKGGTASIPGPFGSGKTVVQQQLAKWADAEIIVYVGCGERGNEMTEVLTQFPKLVDPKTGRPLMERTVLIANTSNMPVAAREASIYTGITIAEYYRDQGFNVALMADSTSRWAEALREVSSRLEEMPGEEGYPAYLGTRLAEFYERAGRVKALSGKIGSVSAIGAVSPPGGDFSEPVTQNTLRTVKVFWGLDSSLSERRHFPSINWLSSYSLYIEQTGKWLAEHVSKGWPKAREKTMALLKKEAELLEVVQIIGPDALPPKERVALEIARMVREDFLQQSAYHEVDTFCPLEKQLGMIETILFLEEQASTLEFPDAKRISELESVQRISRMKALPIGEFKKEMKSVRDRIEIEFAELKKRELLAKKGGGVAK